MAAERRAKEEAEQRKRDEAAAREEARRREAEEKAAAKQREREEKQQKSRSEFTRFLFGGEEPEEAVDEDAPMAPIPGLVERLQKYSGQETVPQPPDDFLGGGTPHLPSRAAGVRRRDPAGGGRGARFSVTLSG